MKEENIPVRKITIDKTFSCRCNHKNANPIKHIYHLINGGMCKIKDTTYHCPICDKIFVKSKIV